MAIRDDFNPKFVYTSPIHFDELDPMQMLHNARFAAHVERAITAWYSTTGRRWESDVQRNPDQYHVVRDLHIEYLNPVFGLQNIRIDVWVERLGTTSCAYGFLCSSEDGSVAYARGTRTIVKLDPASRKPSAWSDFFRREHAALQKDFAAYA